LLVLPAKTGLRPQDRREVRSPTSSRATSMAAAVNSSGVASKPSDRSLRLYASVAHERTEARSDETGDASDLKTKELAKVAQVILAMDPGDSPVQGPEGAWLDCAESGWRDVGGPHRSRRSTTTEFPRAVRPSSMPSSSPAAIAWTSARRPRPLHRGGSRRWSGRGRLGPWFQRRP
jgi:hypothetical protein